jgi:hypothetical protein
MMYELERRILLFFSHFMVLSVKKLLFDQFFFRIFSCYISPEEKKKPRKNEWIDGRKKLDGTVNGWSQKA